MKLAEALLLRADVQKKIESLRERIGRYATVQQGERPHENPSKLLAEAVGAVDRLEGLIYAINRANLKGKLKDGRPLTAALAARDALTLRHSLIKAAVEGTEKPPDRYGLKEIKWVATVDVPKLQKQSDDLSKRIRELNGMIQETNWRVEVDVEV